MKVSAGNQSRILLLLVAVLVTVSIWLTYERTVVLKNFTIEESEGEFVEEN